MGMRNVSGGVGNILKLDCDNAVQFSNLTKKIIVHLKQVTFMLSKLYFNKAFIK